MRRLRSMPLVLVLVVAASAGWTSLASAQQANFPELMRSTSPSDLMTPFATTRAAATTSEVASNENILGLLTVVRIPLLAHDGALSRDKRRPRLTAPR